MLKTVRRFRLALAFTLLIHFADDAFADETDKKWSVFSTHHYQLFYAPGADADGKKVQALLDAGIEALKKEFADFPVGELLRVDCVVYLHPKPTDKASEFSAVITSGVKDDGKYYAVIDLLAPSAYRPSYRSNVDEPPGDDHDAKLVMHEYSTILLERITRAKKGGWRFFSAPKWFTNGYEEYLGLTLTTPRNREAVVQKYLAKHKDGPSRIDFAFGVGVENEYIDGALLLLFMHETFGKQRVQAVLTSEERRFGAAMQSALGVGLEEFQKRWEEWLKKKLK